VNWWLLGGVVVLLAVLAWYSSWTAGRLDRLHHRVATARASLDAELAHRSALVAELAGSDLFDPASALLLLDAAHRARTTDPGDWADREQRESALTRAIAATTGQPLPPAADRREPGWEDELATSMRRVQLARRFHNDVVVSTRDLRRRRLVRWLRLAGHADLPHTIELEDGG
jgi:hypothetical protein